LTAFAAREQMTTMTPLQMLKTIGANKSFYFRLAIRAVRDANCTHEKLHEDPAFDSGRGGLHNNFRGGQAELQKDRQELSHERQQRMQMREELRLHC
jgi:hypothetical protein